MHLIKLHLKLVYLDLFYVSKLYEGIKRQMTEEIRFLISKPAILFPSHDNVVSAGMVSNS